MQGLDLITVDITRKITNERGIVEFDTVVNIGEQRHVIKNTNLSALKDCPETFYCEKLD